MKEYGGYLPLELSEENEYYKYDESSMLRLNCGRSAILSAITDGDYKKVFVPLYTCKSVSEALEKHGIEYEFYHIDSTFMPIDISLKEHELLIWTNYFGLANQLQINLIVERYKNVLLDNTQAFFAEPVMDVYNVYSCRKFLGVSDGAYLIHRGMQHYELKKDVSFETAHYLFAAIEKGTNYAYLMSLENERRIADADVLQMSSLTEKILKSINYKSSILSRRKNFCYLHEKLGYINALKISLSSCVPMVYPLLIESDGLRGYLVKNKIYVPQWWKWVLKTSEANVFEKKLSEYLIPLPVDQRYDEADMEYLSKLILKYIND